ncbi:MAG: putative DNA-binding domain-containing protein [Planctomycetia bacterium]|nr:putative DNA-binding domain-containing protein [Planctomycetia bacterium]
MTAIAAELADLQRWLLAAITEPIGPETAAVEQRLLPSREQSAAERLAVYRSAYVARLLEVLHEQFPCTRFAVGDELFDQFAAGYLKAHPPNSYTLARLADKLVDHLEGTRPADWGAFVVELARLEQTIDRVFDAAGPENLPSYTVPEIAGDSLTLTLAPGLELHAFSYPVSTFYTAWKSRLQPSWPQPQPQFVALLRRDYIVRRHELNRPQYELLSGISRGMPLGEAVAAGAAAVENADSEKLAAEFSDWFATWATSGFFAAPL